MSAEWKGIERRRTTRKTVDQTVLLSLPGDVIVTPCRMLNLSVLGAGIQLRDTPLLSTEFLLSFDDFRMPFKCCLVWRQGDLAGLEFVY
ncbi:PilZ domain-containing protein [Bradyrhizobium rifense]|uniref:PilZ domain-containing protein n=1 Tax=Bradyrhizobium rifense TaxID=515499 RepID=UPI003D31A01F